MNPDKIHIDVISTVHEFDSIEQDWTSLIKIVDAEIFQTFIWQRTWWEFFGENKPLHIITFKIKEQIIGILPMFIDQFYLMGKRIYRCLRMIGSLSMQPQNGVLPVDLALSDYLSIIAHPEYEGRILNKLRTYLNSVGNIFDEILFNELPQKSSLFTKLIPFLKNENWDITKEQASLCPQIKFPETWKGLLSDLSSNARYQIRRDIRKITRDNLFRVEIPSTSKEIEYSFQKLVVFHQERWQDLGMPGIFCDERILGFFREITLRFNEKGWLMLKNLTANGNLIAVDLLFSFKKTTYLVQRGLDINSDYHQFGPGNALLYYVIKEELEKGMEVYDFLRGDESYKFRMANFLPVNQKISLTKQKLRPGLRYFKKVLRGYNTSKIKMTIEREIFNVHTRQDKITGTIHYLENLVNRGVRKINSKQKP